MNMHLNKRTREPLTSCPTDSDGVASFIFALWRQKSTREPLSLVTADFIPEQGPIYLSEEDLQLIEMLDEAATLFRIDLEAPQFRQVDVPSWDHAGRNRMARDMYEPIPLTEAVLARFNACLQEESTVKSKLASAAGVERRNLVRTAPVSDLDLSISLQPKPAPMTIQSVAHESPDASSLPIPWSLLSVAPGRPLPEHKRTDLRPIHKTGRHTVSSEQKD